MNLLRKALWLLSTLSIVYTKSIPRPARDSQAFSIKTNQLRPLWRNSISQLHRRYPDAVSFHVDPNHNYAWTPVQLGGRSNPHQSEVYDQINSF